MRQELLGRSREHLAAVGEDADAVCTVLEVLLRRPAAEAEQRAGKELDDSAQRAGAHGDRGAARRADHLPTPLPYEPRRPNGTAAQLLEAPRSSLAPHEQHGDVVVPVVQRV